MENVPIASAYDLENFRMPVQYVVRPDLDFRGFAGTLASGKVRRGDRVMVLPSGRVSRVKRIATFDGDLEEAFAPMAPCLTLEDEIDISRGDMLVDPARMPHVSRRLEARLVWMSSTALEQGRPYLLKHNTHQTQAKITRLIHRIDIDDLSQRPADRLELNEIGLAAVETTRPLFFDAYSTNRSTGSFILIDPVSNATLAAGMIEQPRVERMRGAAAEIALVETGRVTAAERMSRSGHLAVTVWLVARARVAALVERRLFDRGCAVQALTDDVRTHLLPEAARVLNGAGVIAICSEASDEAEDRAGARELIGERNLLEFGPDDLPPSDADAADRIVAELERRGVFLAEDRSVGEGI